MRLEIADEALAEAADAQHRYAVIDAALGRDFAEAINAALRRIVEEPLLYQSLTPSARRCILPRFPFSVVYQIRSDAIRVIAVMHQARRPGYWRGR